MPQIITGVEMIGVVGTLVGEFENLDTMDGEFKQIKLGVSPDYDIDAPYIVL